MANDNFPRGLVPLNWGDGKTPVHYYRVNTAQDIFLGEPVTLLATGYVVAASNTGVVNALGVAVGFQGPDSGSTATDDPYLDASDLAPLATGLEAGDRLVAVADDPMQRFVIQADTGGTAHTLADIGAFTDMLYRGASANVRAGDTTTGWASLEEDRSAVVTTTAAVLQILGLHETMNSDGTRNAAGNYDKWIVRIAHHQLNTTSAQPDAV